MEFSLTENYDIVNKALYVSCKILAYHSAMKIIEKEREEQVSILQFPVSTLGRQ